jgi:phage terminase Nu1 subunit (DNA packaging protein)
MAEQVRVRKKQLRDQLNRQAEAKSGRVADQWREACRLTKEQFIARELENANHQVDKAEKLLSKWEARLATLQELIDAAKT